MGRGLIFLVGAGVGVFVVLRVRRAVLSAKEQTTPSAIADRFGRAAEDLAARVGEFTTAFTSAMTEREQELRTELGMVDGSAPERAAGR